RAELRHFLVSGQGVQQQCVIRRGPLRRRRIELHGRSCRFHLSIERRLLTIRALKQLIGRFWPRRGSESTAENAHAICQVRRFFKLVTPSSPEGEPRE